MQEQDCNRESNWANQKRKIYGEKRILLYQENTQVIQ